MSSGGLEGTKCDQMWFGSTGKVLPGRLEWPTYTQNWMDGPKMVAVRRVSHFPDHVVALTQART